MNLVMLGKFVKFRLVGLVMAQSNQTLGLV